MEDKQHSVRNPATGEELASVRFSTSSDVEQVVEVAADSFNDWRRTPPIERTQYISDLKSKLEARQENIAQALSREHDKTLAGAHGKIRRGIENVEVTAGIPNMFREQSGVVEDVATEVDAGNIGVNLGVYAPMGFFHFGGRKDSFFGDLHTQDEDTINFFTEKAVTIERWYN